MKGLEKEVKFQNFGHLDGKKFTKKAKNYSEVMMLMQSVMSCQYYILLFHINTDRGFDSGHGSGHMMLIYMHKV